MVRSAARSAPIGLYPSSLLGGVQWQQNDAKEISITDTCYGIRTCKHNSLLCIFGAWKMTKFGFWHFRKNTNFCMYNNINVYLEIEFGPVLFLGLDVVDLAFLDSIDIRLMALPEVHDLVSHLRDVGAATGDGVRDPARGLHLLRHISDLPRVVLYLHVFYQGLWWLWGYSEA